MRPSSKLANPESPRLRSRPAVNRNGGRKHTLPHKRGSSEPEDACVARRPPHDVVVARQPRGIQVARVSPNPPTQGGRSRFSAWPHKPKRRGLLPSAGPSDADHRGKTTRILLSYLLEPTPFVGLLRSPRQPLCAERKLERRLPACPPAVLLI
jgi:hypothetical protein